MYQVVDGKVYHFNEQLGMPENSNLQILVDAWALTIPEEGREDFLKEFNRERLLNRFENGERQNCHRDRDVGLFIVPVAFFLSSFLNFD